MRAAIAHLRERAGEYSIDPERIGLLGASAGAHLAALAALSPSAGAPVKAVVAAYGVYDLKRQWDYELTARPKDGFVEAFLGAAPMQNREVYFQASPISHALAQRNQIAFLLAYGLQDDTVEPTQSEEFAVALGQAGYFVRRFVLPDAGHFWLSDPLDEPHSYSARFAPALMRFLAEKL